jgi:hypothetical protein
MKKFGIFGVVVAAAIGLSACGEVGSSNRMLNGVK